jgi:hypothetical protein
MLMGNNELTELNNLSNKNIEKGKFYDNLPNQFSHRKSLKIILIFNMVYKYFFYYICHILIIIRASNLIR